MTSIEKIKRENEVTTFLLRLYETDIKRENIEKISSEIYEYILKHPTAEIWNEFLLAINIKESTLAELLILNLKNLSSVILQKNQEDAQKTREAFLGC